MTTIAQVAEVVGRAASDAAFRQQLLDSPAATLKSAGIDVPSGVQIEVLENTSSLVTLVLPPRPDGVSDADLQQTGPTHTGGSSAASNLNAWGNLVMNAWVDSDLKSRLKKDPLSVLSERGISMPSGVKVKVVESSAGVSYLILPPASGGAS